MIVSIHFRELLSLIIKNPLKTILNTFNLIGQNMSSHLKNNHVKIKLHWNPVKSSLLDGWGITKKENNVGYCIIIKTSNGIRE